MSLKTSLKMLKKGSIHEIIEIPLPKGNNKKVIGLMKDELGEKIMKEFIGLRTETDSYLIDNCNADKKANATKKCVKKRRYVKKKKLNVTI